MAPSAYAVLAGFFLAWVCGCGSSRPAAAVQPAVPSDTAAEAAVATSPSAESSLPPPVPRHLPAACADASAPICAPPRDFIERLCAKPLQDVALALFAKETPFTRLYLRGKLDELDMDEEVIALRFNGPAKGGMIVGSGKGTYDVLRWDGTCARAVEAEMVARARPTRLRAAHVQWHRIGSAYQDALIVRSDAVKRAHAKRGKECKGAMSGDVSKACESADQALVDAVVDDVRTRGGLPEPATLP